MTRRRFPVGCSLLCLCLGACAGSRAGAPSTSGAGPVDASTGEAQAHPEESASSSPDDRYDAPEAESVAMSAPSSDYDDGPSPAPAMAPPPSPSRRADRKKELERSVAKTGILGIVGDGAAPSTAAPAGGYAPRPVAAPAMEAGRYDDNKQYNRFLTFLAENEALVRRPVDVSERLVIQVLDKDGRSLPNCLVEVKDMKSKVIASSVTFADGRTQFFPADAAQRHDRDFAVTATCDKEKRNGQLSRTGKRENELRFAFARSIPKPVPVDIAIVLDTTGSMGGQIARLKTTLQAIHFQLTQLPTRPDLRFALVAYRDRGDDYVTRVTPFTSDVDQFQRVLDKLDADGGGDTPEDLQQALDDAMHKLDWRTKSIRVGFVVADAVPHLDYDQPYDYRAAMRDGLKRGIKWVTVGAGGLPREGEVIFRQVAQLTMAEYVFVTQGEGGDAEGGVGEASHHVGSNYTTENLDQAIIRIVKRELSYLTDTPRDFDDTIVATAKDKSVPRDKVLAPAVAEVLRQLADYSSIRLKPGTPVAVMPADVTDTKHQDVTEYISEQMIFAAARNPSFKVLERDLSKIGQELKLQLSDLFDAEKSAEVGKLLGAEMLIVAKLQIKADGATLFAKLVRVETGEMLSVAKVDINAAALSGA